MAEHLGKRKRRSSSPPCPDYRNTKTEVIHPSSRIVKQRSRSPEPRHEASPFHSSHNGRPKTPVEDTGLTTHSHVDFKSGSPAATIDKATAPQEISTSGDFNASPRNTSHLTTTNGAIVKGTANILTVEGPKKPKVNLDVPYALTWTEHDLELGHVGSLENYRSNSESSNKSFTTSDDMSMDHVTQGAFPRWSHSCTAIPNSDGKFIIYGGMVLSDKGPIGTNDVSLLSTTDMSLTSLETSGTKPNIRAGHRAVIAGRVLVVFGGPGEDSYLHFLNLDTREWSKFRPPAPYPGPRLGHSFIIVHNTIWLYGGLQMPVELDDMWCLDLGNDGIEQVRWRRIPKKDPWPQARSYHSTVYYDGSLYLFAGWIEIAQGRPEEQPEFNDLWKFEMSTETWTKIQCHGQIPQPRSNHAATVIGDNMFIFGGLIEANAEG